MFRSAFKFPKSIRTFLPILAGTTLISSQIISPSRAFASPTNEEHQSEKEFVLEYKSQTRPSSPQHPKRPGIHVVVADSIDDLVYKSGKDVLIEMYSPDCPSCARFEIIFDQVAFALRDVSSVRIAVMDGENNTDPSFLTEKQASGFPTVLFFPSSTWSIPQEKRPKAMGELATEFELLKAKDIIQKVHALSSTKFDLDKALSRAAEYDKTMQQRMRALMKEQFEEERMSVPKSYIQLAPPCGAMFHQLYSEQSILSFSSVIPSQKEQKEKEEELKQLWSRWQQCMLSSDQEKWLNEMKKGIDEQLEFLEAKKEQMKENTQQKQQ